MERRWHISAGVWKNSITMLLAGRMIFWSQNPNIVTGLKFFFFCSGSGRAWIPTWDFRENKKARLSHTELFCSQVLYWIWDAYALWTFRWILFKEDTSTGWSKSEGEKQISYINMYMWNVEIWYRWSYVRSRNRDIDVENKHMDTKGERTGWDELRDWDWYTYTTIYTIDNEWEPSA